MEESKLVNCHTSLGPQIKKQINYEVLILLCPGMTYFTRGVHFLGYIEVGYEDGTYTGQLQDIVTVYFGDRYN